MVVDSLLAELRVELIYDGAGFFRRRQTQFHTAHIALMNDLRGKEESSKTTSGETIFATNLSFGSVFVLLKKSAASFPAVTSL